MLWTVRWEPRLQRYVRDPPDQQPFNFVWSAQYQVAMHQPETWGYVVFVDGGGEEEGGGSSGSVSGSGESGGDGGGGGGSSAAEQTAGAAVAEEAAAEAAAAAALALGRDPTWPARAWLMEVYTAQHARRRAGRGFARSAGQLAREDGVRPPPEGAGVFNATVEATSESFFAAASVAPPAPAPDAADAAGRGAGGGGDPCAPGRRAVAGGWRAADRPARLYVTTQGRLDLAFPGGDGSLERVPEEGGSKWC